MTPHEIGQAIKLTRDKKELSQRVLAEKAGIRHATLTDIENGKSNCRLSTLIQIAEALGCELEVKLRKK